LRKLFKNLKNIGIQIFKNLKKTDLKYKIKKENPEKDILL
jgi:hypothetical protein